MKRDMDLIRTLLLKFENDAEDAFMHIDFAEDRDGLIDHSPYKVAYHVMLLEDAGFIKGAHDLGSSMGGFVMESITWKGHEFLDDIRDPKIWKLTKEGAKKAGVRSLSIMWELAKGYGKQEVKKHLGFDLE